MVLRRFQAQLIQLPPLSKRILLAFCDALLLVTAMAGTILVLGYGGRFSLGPLLALLPVTVVAGIAIIGSQGLYRPITRFIGTEMVFAMFRAAALIAVVLALLALYLSDGNVRLSVTLAVTYWSLAALALTAGRLLMRAFVLRRFVTGDQVAIYGAGRAGVRLASALAHNPDFLPVAFLDDNPQLHGRMVAGLPVVSPTHLGVLVAELNVRRVLLALPSVSRQVRKQIVDQLAGYAVHVQTVPDIGDLVRGAARVDQLQDVGALDLLGREPVPPSQELLSRCVTGKSVMVTGAGGSIGAELCRQLIELRPRRLVLFELSELNLYQVDLELNHIIRERDLQVELVPLLGSVHHQDRVQRTMSAFGVQTVYHAAAYKHVPLVEANMMEGVHNNLVGTWHAAEAAEAAGVEVFVLVSTDKAVLPANVMGATKRCAELVLQAMAERGSSTRFCMVRFGNVLESSGSVVPLFREQIRAGGPVTVTDPNVIRYFMTIPEAAQLVIQAGSMGRGGDVFVLDMGEPVRIDDLARRMINLMGRTVRDDANPDGDIPIHYTGLRAGEKLYEELLIGSNVARTSHPMIMQAFEEFLPWARLRPWLGQIVAAATSFDCERVQSLLLEVVQGYSPACRDIEDLVWRAPVRREPAPAEPAPARRLGAPADADAVVRAVRARSG